MKFTTIALSLALGIVSAHQGDTLPFADTWSQSTHRDEPITHKYTSCSTQFSHCPLDHVPTAWNIRTIQIEKTTIYTLAPSGPRSFINGIVIPINTAEVITHTIADSAAETTGCAEFVHRYRGMLKTVTLGCDMTARSEISTPRQNNTTASQAQEVTTMLRSTTTQPLATQKAAITALTHIPAPGDTEEDITAMEKFLSRYAENYNSIVEEMASASAAQSESSSVEHPATQKATFTHTVLVPDSEPDITDVYNSWYTEHGSRLFEMASASAAQSSEQVSIASSHARQNATMQRSTTTQAPATQQAAPLQGMTVWQTKTTTVMSTTTSTSVLIVTESTTVNATETQAGSTKTISPRRGFTPILAAHPDGSSNSTKERRKRAIDHDRLDLNEWGQVRSHHCCEPGLECYPQQVRCEAITEIVRRVTVYGPPSKPCPSCPSCPDCPECPKCPPGRKCPSCPEYLDCPECLEYPASSAALPQPAPSAPAVTQYQTETKTEVVTEKAISTSTQTQTMTSTKTIVATATRYAACDDPKNYLSHYQGRPVYDIHPVAWQTLYNAEFQPNAQSCCEACAREKDCVMTSFRIADGYCEMFSLNRAEKHDCDGGLDRAKFFVGDDDVVRYNISNNNCGRYGYGGKMSAENGVRLPE